MSVENEGVKQALEKLEKAEERVERDEERLAEDQEQVREAINELEEAQHEHLITIIVDRTDHKVRPGEWVVAKLKEHLKIDAARVLAEVTPNGLKDLPDDAVIELHESQRFMTHARKGGSS